MPHRSFTLHKVFERLVKEKKEKERKNKVETVPPGKSDSYRKWGCNATLTPKESTGSNIKINKDEQRSMKIDKEW